MVVVSGRNMTGRICPVFMSPFRSPKRDTEETTEYRQAAVNRSETTLVKTMRCFPVSTNKSADIPIRSLLNIVILHLNSLDIQLVNVHSSYFQCFSFSEVSHSI